MPVRQGSREGQAFPHDESASSGDYGLVWDLSACSFSTTYTYDADDRMTSLVVGPVEFTYVYDDNGNLIRELDELENPTNYYYDHENRLVKVVYPQGESCEYGYAPGGERMRAEAWPCTSTTRYSYDGNPHGFQQVVAEYDSYGNEMAGYTHGPGVDRPVMMVRDGVHYAFHPDRLGSIRNITNESEDSVRAYTYDAFGVITAEQGSLANNYTFTGRELDDSSGMYYYRARWYSPTIGRFTDTDPVGISCETNVYVYAGNNPVGRTDPCRATRRCRTSIYT